MTLPTWPSNLGYAFERSSWASTQGDIPALISETQYGISRMRPASRLRVHVQQGSLFFTYAEVAIFDAFVFTTLGRGTSAFYMPIWTGADYQTRKVQIQGAANKITRKSLGLGQEVSFSLQIYEAAV